MTDIPNYRVNFHGHPLDRVGLSDAWVVGPDLQAIKIAGLTWYHGQGIIESLLSDIPADHVVIFDRHPERPINVLVLH